MRVEHIHATAAPRAGSSARVPSRTLPLVEHQQARQQRRHCQRCRPPTADKGWVRAWTRGRSPRSLASRSRAARRRPPRWRHAGAAVGGRATGNPADALADKVEGDRADRATRAGARRAHVQAPRAVGLAWTRAGASSCCGHGAAGPARGRADGNLLRHFPISSRRLAVAAARPGRRQDLRSAFERLDLSAGGQSRVKPAHRRARRRGLRSARRRPQARRDRRPHRRRAASRRTPAPASPAAGYDVSFDPATRAVIAELAGANLPSAAVLKRTLRVTFSRWSRTGWPGRSHAGGWLLAS